MDDHNPYSAPDTFSDVREVALDARDYGGFGRLQYFVIYVGFVIVSNGLQYALIAAGSPEAAIALSFISLIVFIWLLVQRLKNLGYSGWWALGIIVPLLNILVAIRCLAAPEGYADHKTLDGAGKTIVGLILGLFVLAIVSVVVMSMNGM